MPQFPAVSKKIAYDIWRDTVNTAQRMESSGEAGKVNISGSTHELVKTQFRCTYHGKIETRGKIEVDCNLWRAGSRGFWRGIEDCVLNLPDGKPNLNHSLRRMFDENIERGGKLKRTPK